MSIDASGDTPPEEDIFSFGDNYLYDTKWYYERFPLAWARSHKPLTGPNECKNCAHHGSLHNESIFVGYCVNCARYVYKYERGHGFREGVEDASADSTIPSAQETYLRGVDLDDIPPLLTSGSEDEEEDDDDDGNEYDDDKGTILECHFEGGYNDF